MRDFGVDHLTPLMRRIVHALEREGDMDARELADAACTCYDTLSGGGYLRKMLSQELIRVSGWRRNYPGAATPIYSVTPGKSAQKPPPISRSERARRWRKRVGYYSAEYRRRVALRELVKIMSR